MMKDGTGLVCGVLLLVFLFNLGMLMPILRRGGKIFSNPLEAYRLPWDVEREAIAELRQSLLALDQVPEEETRRHDDQ